MQRICLFAVSLVFGVGFLAARALQVPAWSPKEIVEQYWNLAMQGDLLSRDGRQRASRLFVDPELMRQNDTIEVRSNYYALEHSSIDGNRAEIYMEYGEVGKINPALVFTRAKATIALKTSLRYQLVFAPTLLKTFGPDGKTVVQEAKGLAEWKIQSSSEPPWTTVNTAIRYVLEMSRKTTDPVIKKNADATVTALLALH
ncbi:MAG: hypothetical protein WAK20_09050 [Candidatus Acidiferrum sp.]